MEIKLLGEIFGIQIHSPINRSEVREVVKNQYSYRIKIRDEMRLTDEQSRLEVSDLYERFCDNLNESDRNIFEKIFDEEVVAAPHEWFIEYNKDLASTSELISNSHVGELFGVQVEYPFNRKNIRVLVDSRSKLMNQLADDNQISLYQASNDLSDEQDIFLKTMNHKDQEAFLNIMTEELIAHTNALNDETDRINQETIKQEIENQYFTQVIGGIIGFAFLMFIFFAIMK